MTDEQTPLTEDEKIIMEIINQRGFLVIGCLEKRKPRDIIPAVTSTDGKMNLRSPLYVIGPSNRAEMDQQNALAALLMGEAITPATQQWPYFYRVRCD